MHKRMVKDGNRIKRFRPHLRYQHNAQPKEKKEAN